VLVFGSTGEGKTSLLNCLTDTNNPVSSGVRGCTFETTEHAPVQFQGCNWIFYDTVGLNEPDSSRTSHTVALQNLLDLLRTAAMGFNLLIMVVKAGRETTSFKKNYELFVDGISRFKVPVICVVTGCENEKTEKRTMQDWVRDNRPKLEQNRMCFAEMVAGCCAVSRGELELFFKDLREETKFNVWQAIADKSSPQPIQFVEKEKSFLEHIFNIFWSYFPGQSLEYNKDIHDALMKYGCSDLEAKSIASHFRS